MQNVKTGMSFNPVKKNFAELYRKILLFLFLISKTLPVVDSPALRAETRKSSPLG